MAKFSRSRRPSRLASLSRYTGNSQSSEREISATGSARYRGAVFGGERLDAGERGTGADDDRTGAGAVLRRTGPTEEYAGDHDAEFCSNGDHYGDVGAG